MFRTDTTRRWAVVVVVVVVIVVVVVVVVVDQSESGVHFHSVIKLEIMETHEEPPSSTFAYGGYIGNWMIVSLLIIV